MRAATTQSGSKSCRSRSSPVRSAPYRDSLFLERAVVGERLRLAMGLPLRKFSEFSLLSDGVEKALDPDIYYESRSSTSSSSRATAARTTL